MGGEIELRKDLLDGLRPVLPRVSTAAVQAIMAEVPAYDRALDGVMGETITSAVQMALAGFLRVAARGQSNDVAAPLSPALEGAYALGAAESRSGRSVEALLAAYRIGARVSWREMSGVAVENGADAQTLATLAGLVFAYIDELSAASVAGHADEQENTGRVLRQRLDRLGQALLRGEPSERLETWVERAEWRPPRHLTAVLLPPAQVRPLLALVGDASLHPTEVPETHDDHAVVLVAGPGSRSRLLGALAGRQAVVGPTVPWAAVSRSYRRALRALREGLVPDESGVVDTEAHLPRLVVTGDADAWGDLRAEALSPLADLTPTARAKLAATLRAWLLLQGRRDLVAAHLYVHPQTVRYRMGQLRELFGDALDDPDAVESLVLALAAE